MKIVVSGSTGFIGRRLCLELLRRGHDVSAWVRNVDRARSSVPYPVKFVRWNGTFEGLPRDDLRDAHAVVHLAGENISEGRWSEERKRKIVSSRVESTEALVDAIRAMTNRPQIFICASAVGIYGSQEALSLDEGAPHGSDFLAEVCKSWEKASAGVDELGVRRVNVRFGVVLGREGGMLEKLTPVFERFAGGPIGTGKQWMSWIHLDDAVRAIVFALEHPEVRGPLNVTSPKPETNRNFARKLGAALHRPALLKTPAFAMRAAMGEMASIALTGQRALPRKLREAGFEFRYEELDEAFREIFGQDFEPGEREFLSEQWVPKSVEQVFPYFAEAKNLETLTPSFLGFEILSQSTPALQKGTLIEYRLKIHGIPVRWRTLIESWNSGKGFSDIQLKGPYRKWHHWHSFEALKGGTLITDRVRYRLPLGGLGALAAGRVVSRDVRQIFEFRRKVIRETFGSA